MSHAVTATGKSMNELWVLEKLKDSGEISEPSVGKTRSCRTANVLAIDGALSAVELNL